MPTSLTVTWAPSTRTNGIVYRLQYRPLGASVWINATPAMQTGTTRVVTGLTEGQMYEFRHISSNQPIWTDVSVPTQILAGSTVPSAPTGLRVTP